MKSWIGKFIAMIGVIHTVFGLVVFRATLAELWGDGLLNTVNGQPDREMAYWFLAFGLMAILLGCLADWIERRGSPLPAFLGWALLALTILMVAVMPVSGGWLVFVPALGILRRSGRSPLETTRPG